MNKRLRESCVKSTAKIKFDFITLSLTTNLFVFRLSVKLKVSFFRRIFLNKRYCNQRFYSSDYSIRALVIQNIFSPIIDLG